MTFRSRRRVGPGPEASHQRFGPDPGDIMLRTFPSEATLERPGPRPERRCRDLTRGVTPGVPRRRGCVLARPGPGNSPRLSRARAADPPPRRPAVLCGGGRGRAAKQRKQGKSKKLSKECSGMYWRYRSHFGSRYKSGCCGHAGLLVPLVRSFACAAWHGSGTARSFCWHIYHVSAHGDRSDVANHRNPVES